MNVCWWRRVYDICWHFNNIYITFTLPHQQMFIDISNFDDFFLSVCREPSLVSSLMSLVSCLLSPFSCLPSLVSCLLSLVSCLPSSVSRLLSHIPCLLSHVSHAVSAADLIYYDIADLAILWSKFADLGNLSILTLLADLAVWKQIFFSERLADLEFSVSPFSWAKLELAISD